MAGRIRSIKPELLDDTAARDLSDSAWRLYVSLFVLVDENGRFSMSYQTIAARVWQDTTKPVGPALDELIKSGLVKRISIGDRLMVQLVNWEQLSESPNATRKEITRWVYIVESRGTGKVKIGSARNVASRMRKLMTGSPGQLVLLATLPGGFEVENQLHKRFAHLRVFGEWFQCEGELAEFIDTLRADDAGAKGGQS